jgi:hypothetical protein
MLALALLQQYHALLVNIIIVLLCLVLLVQLEPIHPPQKVQAVSPVLVSPAPIVQQAQQGLLRALRQQGNIVQEERQDSPRALLGTPALVVRRFL